MKCAQWGWLGCLCLATCGWGQQEPAGELPAGETRTEGQMVIAAATEDGGEVQMSAITFSSDGEGGANVMTFGGPVGGAIAIGGSSDLSQFLVNDPAVQSEIELTDDQLSQIRKMNAEFGKEIKSKIEASMREPNRDRGEMAELIATAQRQQSERLGEILVPHQLDRLKQLSFQRNEKFAGVSGAILGQEIAEKLGISDEQKEKIKAKAEELKKELDAKIAELQENMRTELLDELSSEQRAKLEELRGAKFDFKDEMPRPRFPARRMRTTNSDDN